MIISDSRQEDRAEVNQAPQNSNSVSRGNAATCASTWGRRPLCTPEPAPREKFSQSHHLNTVAEEGHHGESTVPAGAGEFEMRLVLVFR